MEKHLEMIRKAHIFRGIPKEEFKVMLETLDSQLKNYSAGQVVLKSGRRVRRAGLLLEGSVEICREDFWGSRRTIGSVQPGELFAVSFAAAERAVADVTCYALTGSVVLWLNLHGIFDLRDGAGYHASLISNIMSALALQNLDLNAKLTHITRKTTREKLLSYLSEEAWKQNTDEFDIPFSRQQLADYLSVERSAMSAELSRLQKQGYFISKRSHFRLLKLQEEAE